MGNDITELYNDYKGSKILFLSWLNSIIWIEISD